MLLVISHVALIKCVDREGFGWGIKGPALTMFILSSVIFLDVSDIGLPESYILQYHRYFRGSVRVLVPAHCTTAHPQQKKE